MIELQESERHHSDLNIFAAVAAIMECGCLYTQSGQRMAGKIVKMCIREQQLQIRAYDKAKAKSKATAKTTTES